jgi:hypothetical protein
LRSIPLGIGFGMLFGWVLSSLAAAGQGDHYWKIVLPGMRVGAVVGFVTQRHPRDDRIIPAPGEHTSALIVAIAFALCAPAAVAQGGRPKFARVIRLPDR